jgi:hypothetical protein
MLRGLRGSWVVGLVTVVALSAVPRPSVEASAEHPEAAVVADRIMIGVDERIELFSVLERLAGRPEYNVADTPYARAADEWFAPYAEDPAVVAFQQLELSNGISYDAAITLAVHLDDQLAPTVPLDPRPEGLDPRWDGVDIAALLELVSAFATTARFDEFMAAQVEHVAAAEDAFRSFLLSRPLIGWFDLVFGVRDRASYHVVPGLLTGLMSFGPHVGTDHVYAVMSLEAPDENGVPVLSLLTEEYLVHEFAHTYVNPVVRANLEVFQGASPLLDAAVPAMEQQHYPTREIVVAESLVRALTVLYLYDEVSPDAALASLETQIGLGFVWTRDLVLALDAAADTSNGTLSDEQLVDAAATVLMREG